MPSNLTTIPAPRVPLISADTGLISTEWYRFLFNLYTLAGSGSNLTTLDDLQLGPPTQPVTTSGGGGSGTVTSVSTGTGLSGGPITTTGTISFAVAAVGTWAATPSSANLLAAMTDETGTGSLVFATSPTLVTPILGTPTSGNFSTGTFTWPTFNQNTTGYAASLAGGLAGSLPYQSAVNTTTFLAAGTNGQVLTLAAGVPSWATPTTGTVTSVSGTGSVNGITLTGTVTSSGSLTLGGTLGSIANSQLTNSSVTFNGVAVALGASGTITATATNALTIGTGLSGTSYNGSTAVTIANTGVLSVTGTAPVVSSGGQNPAISMAAATTSVSGYLTNTDWTTFNNKQAALVSGTNIKTVGGNSLLGSGDVGTIGIGYGGTGQTTANAAFNALSPLTTAGDTLYGGTSGVGTRLSIGTAGQVLTVNAGATAPQWSTPTTGTVTSVSVVSANGFAGTVATATTTPAITVSTSITGILKGNATAISAATAGTDYSAGTSANTSGLVYSTTTTGALTTATGAQVSTALGTTAISGNAANVTGIVVGANGGTGVANTGSTITVGGNLSHAGAFTQTFTATANTSLTLPVSGTLISTVTNMAANPVTGTPSSTTYLRGDGTWATVTASSSNITALGLWENKKIISANYSITSGNSAMSAGPITINSGVSVTVPSGSRWVVL
jgi:hypothetical protein